MTSPTGLSEIERLIQAFEDAVDDVHYFDSERYTPEEATDRYDSLAAAKAAAKAALLAAIRETREPSDPGAEAALPLLDAAWAEMARVCRDGSRMSIPVRPPDSARATGAA